MTGAGIAMNTIGGTGRGHRDAANGSAAARARRRYFARLRCDNRPFFTLTLLSSLHASVPAFDSIAREDQAAIKPGLWDINEA